MQLKEFISPEFYIINCSSHGFMCPRLGTTGQNDELYLLLQYFKLASHFTYKYVQSSSIHYLYYSLTLVEVSFVIFSNLKLK